MTVSRFVATWLRERAITHVFTLPGGMIAPLLDALHATDGIELVTMHHEQGIAFAVDGYGRFHGRPAVALSTGGPGATNMITGIASCYLDSIPAVFIVGQVQSYLLRRDRRVRQFGFQECDVLGMVAPVVKGAWRPSAADQVPDMLEQAWHLATQGRPGPVLIELPVDLQSAEIDGGLPAKPWPIHDQGFSDRSVTSELLDALAAAERPLILAGGGVWAAMAATICRRFVRTVRVPMASSITALDVLPATDPLRLGMIGMYGNRWVNLLAHEADVVLVLGSKLDHGTVGTDTAAWARNRTIFQVDCDPGEMARVPGVRAITADLRAFLTFATSLSAERDFPQHPDWLARAIALKHDLLDTDELSGCDGINPNVLIRQLSAASHGAAAYVVDAGQHLWWACQSIQPRDGQRFIVALGLGAVGFSLPAAIGVAASCRSPVVVVIGDGALQFNIQEFQTIVRNHLPIKIVLLNNRCHGSVRQLQEKLFGGRYPTTVWGYDTPQFPRVADAYGIKSLAVADPEHVEPALAWLWADPQAPGLVDFAISPELNVYPNVAFGASLTQMEAWHRV